MRNYSTPLIMMLYLFSRIHQLPQKMVGWPLQLLNKNCVSPVIIVTIHQCPEEVLHHGMLTEMDAQAAVCTDMNLYNSFQSGVRTPKWIFLNNSRFLHTNTIHYTESRIICVIKIIAYHRFFVSIFRRYLANDWTCDIAGSLTASIKLKYDGIRNLDGRMSSWLFWHTDAHMGWEIE